MCAAQNCHHRGFLFALLSRILWIKVAPEKFRAGEGMPTQTAWF
jgi:hypothetical protein